MRLFHLSSPRMRGKRWRKPSCVFVVRCTATFQPPGLNDPPAQIDERSPEFALAFGIALTYRVADVFRRTELGRETFDERLSKETKHVNLPM